MDSRRLVVWISAGILGFQGGTLALDLINCTVLSWLWVNRNGLAPAASPASAAAEQALGTTASGEAEQSAGPDAFPSPGDMPTSPPGTKPQPTQRPGASPIDPMGLFCERPRGRIDAAVGQGLTILAGLALGGSVGSGSRGDQP